MHLALRRVLPRVSPRARDTFHGLVSRQEADIGRGDPGPKPAGVVYVSVAADGGDDQRVPRRLDGSDPGQ